MPVAALKSLSKKAKISLDRAEHLWDKAKDIVKKEYKIGEDDPSFWALTIAITKKMMGVSESISFKQFLEAAAIDGKQPEFDSITADEVFSILSTKCSDAYWMLQGGYAIYKGLRGSMLGELKQKEYMVVDPSKTIRKSQNTTNHYTAIMDNTPSLRDFPKRSRSFIATTNDLTAREFTTLGTDDEVIVLIPFNGVKIGFCSWPDIWLAEIFLFGEKFHLDKDFNLLFIKNKIPDTWEGLKEFDEKLKEDNEESINKFYSMFKNAEPGDHTSFLETVDRALDPKLNDEFKLHTTKSLYDEKYINDNEVWVGGPCVAMTMAQFHELSKQERKKK